MTFPNGLVILKFERVNGHCPYCAAFSVFKPLANSLFLLKGTADVGPGHVANSMFCGLAVCENPECLHTFYFEVLICDFIFNGSSEGRKNEWVLQAHNKQRQEGNFKNTFPLPKPLQVDEIIPTPVKEAFQLALDCHSQGLYIPCGSMLRRTLEIFLKNLKEIHANTEKCKDSIDKLIKWLEGEISNGKIGGITPKAINFFNQIRLYGNDNCHSEGKHFELDSAEASTTAIKYFSTYLKAYYDYQNSDALEEFKLVSNSDVET